MYQAVVNQEVKMEVSLNEAGYLVDGTPFTWDLIQTVGQNYHVIKDNKSYTIEVVSLDTATKTCVLKINGGLHEVILKDQTDVLMDKMGMGAAKSNALRELKAPMPGLIYQLPVKVGDAVAKGDVLLVLVAMKMENAIKAQGEGVVKAIHVNLNDSVEKNQVLISFA
ncbi:MAG: biotin/lipoyl-containing protein [Spirosomataceae bacterium]